MPEAEVVLVERNQSSDAFGFGVVFSDATLRRIHEADPVLMDGLRDYGTHWETIEVWLKGEKISFGGNGMTAIHRKALLSLLQSRAREFGVQMRFGENTTSLDSLDGFDLIVAADGANSLVREKLGVKHLGHEVETATAKFIWFGTTFIFDGLTFIHRRSEHGNFAAHAYPISSELSTFIVETNEVTWRRAGLDVFDSDGPPGPSDEKSQHYLEALFAGDIGGEPLVANNSRWANFRTRRTVGTWHSSNVVLLGDAAHTAHFSVGSGTKMAMEDAVVLAREVAKTPSNLGSAIARYEAERMPQVAKIHDAARPSLSWWEHFGRNHEALEPLQFAFHFASRSIGIGKIRQRDPDLVKAVEDDWRSRHGASPRDSPLVAVSGETFKCRRLRVLADGEALVGVTDGVTELRLDGAGVVAAIAPDNETDMDEAINLLPATPSTVLLSGGNAFTRALLAEEARLAKGHTVILLGTADDDEFATLLLSGRVDAVASPNAAHNA